MLSSKKRVGPITAKKRNLKKKLFLIYPTNILIANHTHIGFKKSLTSNTFRKALLGYYSGISIIDPSLTLSNIRYMMNFLSHLMLKNRRVCFVMHDIPDNWKRVINFKNQYWFLNCWVSGYLTNFRYVRFYVDRSRSFCAHIPSALILFGVEDQRSGEIALESNKLKIPSFAFIDSNSNPTAFQYWIPINLKSGFTKLFFINTINSFVGKIFLQKNSLFVKLIAKILKHKNWKQAQEKYGEQLQRYRPFKWLRRYSLYEAKRKKLRMAPRVDWKKKIELLKKKNKRIWMLKKKKIFFNKNEK